MTNDFIQSSLTNLTVLATFTSILYGLLCQKCAKMRKTSVAVTVNLMTLGFHED